MSVLCCSIPEFTIRSLCQSNPHMAGQPLALLDEQGRITALSAQARHSNVQPQMTIRQAQMRCPDLRLHPLTETECHQEQAALLSLLANWELPVEEIGWGRAYVDLKPLTAKRGEVKLLATDLGQRVRQELGEALQPALGWDSSKFTARAAAHYAQPGRIRLVDKADEQHFLHNLSIKLLPLSANALQQLNWMGIRTLGQFANLPANAVRQRFGKAGIQAQQWAQGQDNRPVQSTLPSQERIINSHVEIDPPSNQLDQVLQPLIATLRPLLGTITMGMEGLRQIQLAVTFSNGELAEINHQWIDPIGCQETLSAAITNQLTNLSWPDSIMQITITQIKTSELPAHQMGLFPEFAEQPLESSEATTPNNRMNNKSNRAINNQRKSINLSTCFANLIERHGPIFWQPQLTNTNHPVAERRAIYLPV